MRPHRSPEIGDRKKRALLPASHVIALGIGFAAGIYLLPILTAPEGPRATEVKDLARTAGYKARFRHELEGSDFVHRRRAGGPPRRPV
jgi:hypothetical protein